MNASRKERACWQGARFRVREALALLGGTRFGAS